MNIEQLAEIMTATPGIVRCKADVRAAEGPRPRRRLEEVSTET